MPDLDILSVERVRELASELVGDLYSAEERELLADFVVGALGDAHLAVASANPVRTPDGTPIAGKLYAGSGRFFNIGAPAKVLVGFVLAAFLGAPAHLASLKALIRFDRQRMPHLITVFRQLDGIERDVFDALHTEFARWVVVNYDYVRDPHQQGNAYGHIWPTAEQVAEVLDRSLVDIQGALIQLQEDGVVRVDNGRWAIVF
jgi:hypothetical protein